MISSFLALPLAENNFGILRIFVSNRLLAMAFNYFFSYRFDELSALEVGKVVCN